MTESIRMDPPVGVITTKPTKYYKFKDIIFDPYFFYLLNVRGLAHDPSEWQ